MVKERKKAVFNWSGGKDSALALDRVLRGDDYRVVALLTTVNRSDARSSMHGIPAGLLRAQSDSIGLPIRLLELEPGGGMETYERAMARAVEDFVRQGADTFVFGDIFLEDIRAYRERQLAPFGVTVAEPLWGKDSAGTMADFLASGLETVVVTVDADRLGESWVGRRIDGDFCRDLPSGVDPCGENGEYHTFCYGGGMFRRPVPFRLGKPERRSYPVTLDDGTVRHYAYWFAGLQEP